MYDLDKLYVFEIVISPVIQRFILIVVICSLCISLLLSTTLGSVFEEYSTMSSSLRYTMFNILGLYMTKESKMSSLITEGNKYIKMGMDVLLYFIHYTVFAFFLGVVLYETELIEENNRNGKEGIENK